MVTSNASKIVFPKIHRVVIRNLSVYTQRPEIQLEVLDGVFCLAGANGLGKSTFIAALNFGLTGRVPDPNRTFLSVDEYYEDTEVFSKNYFDGRVRGIGRESAEIELGFTVGDHVYTIVRGLFEPGRLRSLQIIGPNFENSIAGTPEALQGIYESRLPVHMGLRSFEQFAFLQHFVLTFDERRALAFWEKNVLQAALFLTFGNEPEVAAEAEDARRQAERLDSLARNLNYHATDTNNKLMQVQQDLANHQSIAEDVLVRHKSLDSQKEELAEQLETLEREVGDKRLRINSLGAELVNLRRLYEDTFAQRSLQQHGIEVHPMIVRSLSESKCHLCGDSTHLDELRDRSHGSSCPLCGALVSNNGSDSQDSLEKLKELDKNIADTQTALDSDDSAFRRLEDERMAVEARAKQVEAEILELEANNQGLRSNLEATGILETKEIVSAYRKQVDDLRKRRDQCRVERDVYSNRVRELQLQLMQSYSLAELEFLPRFRDLARAFLGLDLDARLEIQRHSLNLVLEVEGLVRRETHDLSESQRFFLDIALRMAIGKFVAAEAGPVTMYIDTPEGSLDIAYESRAGEMFAQFVKEGSHLMMTANINTSKLLQRLALRCGHKRMKLERMTDWTQLSDVQLDEEDLFREAFDEIESALVSGDDSNGL